MSAAANESPRCTKCYRATAATDCAGWCTQCYYAATANLSPKQLALLCRAAAIPIGCIVLERHDLGPAAGLERRKLVRTNRPSKRSWSTRPKYEPGSRRHLDLTLVGRAFVETMSPEQRERLASRAAVEPVELEEAIALARDVARAVLHDDGDPSTHLRNLARGVLERLAGDADREVDDGA